MVPSLDRRELTKDLVPPTTRRQDASDPMDARMCDRSIFDGHAIRDASHTSCTPLRLSWNPFPVACAAGAMTPPIEDAVWLPLTPMEETVFDSTSIVALPFLEHLRTPRPVTRWRCARSHTHTHALSLLL